MRRALVSGLVLALMAAGLAGCNADRSTVSRPGQPQVLTGAQLPALRGQAPGRIVAFRLTRAGDVATWTQIPVQVDQRKVVPFGSHPSSNATSGVTGTVYGSGSGGPTALQYADPDTFVGADGNPSFDSDDELVFMVDDAGGQHRSGDAATPSGAVAGSGVEVQLDDPQAEGGRAWVYLFTSDGSLVPSAGRDYVDYDFHLTSGPYKTTYRRSAGPNPETSRVVTDAYRVGFRDRWLEDSWQVRAGNASQTDVLDGHKNQFATNVCGRSNVTFAEGEGAFVANIDGPVRAIRSYIGANSGPRTQRTHKLYRTREVIVSNLRVHAIPGILDFVDYSSAAIGMVYRSSTRPSGVRIDGARDPITSAVAEWETVSGPQGTIFTRSNFATDAAGVREGESWLYRDQRTPSDDQCWGDASYLAASGPVLGAIPNTDPGAAGFNTLTTTRTVQFGPPDPSGPHLVAAAEAWAADVATPLRVTITGVP